MQFVPIHTYNWQPYVFSLALGWTMRWLQRQPNLMAERRTRNMNMFETKDGTSIFYKDWGTGPVVTFSHGWPLSSDAWDAQMLFLGQQGYRVIAHDRRGHGRS